jgi:alpha-beta hydrolase superfamily lysophospholipase
MKWQESRLHLPELGNIYYQYWEPTAPPRALVVLVHGAGEHSSRYQHVAKHLTDRGFVVAALDQPGHGLSDGIPGYIARFDDYLAALRHFHNRVNDDFPTLPKCLLGHSMGGLVSANYLLEHQGEFFACALSGPAIKTDLEPGFAATQLVKLLAMITPRLGLLQLDPSGVSRDPAVVDQYRSDPKVHHGKMSARKMRELFVGMRRIQDHAGQITLPTLILHGECDVLAAPSGSELLHRELGSASKTLKIYPELYHEIFNEPEQEQVLSDLAEWLEQALVATAVPA